MGEYDDWKKRVGWLRRNPHLVVAMTVLQLALGVLLVARCQARMGRVPTFMWIEAVILNVGVIAIWWEQIRHALRRATITFRYPLVRSDDVRLFVEEMVLSDLDELGLLTEWMSTPGKLHDLIEDYATDRQLHYRVLAGDILGGRYVDDPSPRQRRSMKGTVCRRMRRPHARRRRSSSRRRAAASSDGPGSSSDPPPRSASRAHDLVLPVGGAA